LKLVFLQAWERFRLPSVEGIFISKILGGVIGGSKLLSFGWQGRVSISRGGCPFFR